MKIKSTNTVRIRLESTALVHTPGMVRRCIQMYKGDDRKNALELMLALCDRTISRRVIKDILSGKLVGTLEDNGETIAFEIPTSDYYPLQEYKVCFSLPAIEAVYDLNNGTRMAVIWVKATGHDDARKRVSKDFMETLERELNDADVEMVGD